MLVADAHSAKHHEWAPQLRCSDTARCALSTGINGFSSDIRDALPFKWCTTGWNDRGSAIFKLADTAMLFSKGKLSVKVIAWTHGGGFYTGKWVHMGNV